MVPNLFDLCRLLGFLWSKGVKKDGRKAILSPDPGQSKHSINGSYEPRRADPSLRNAPGPTHGRETILNLA